MRESSPEAAKKRVEKREAASLNQMEETETVAPLMMKTGVVEMELTDLVCVAGVPCTVVSGEMLIVP